MFSFPRAGYEHAQRGAPTMTAEGAGEGWYWGIGFGVGRVCRQVVWVERSRM
jgi:hypothetical protein